MYRKVFIDSSAWIAHALRGERFHEEMRKLVKELVSDGCMLFTSNDVIDETVTRLLSQTNFHIVKTFIGFMRQAVKTKTLVELWSDEQVQEEGLNLVEKYFDHRVSLTDATTVVLMKRFHIETILTLDSDFTKIGLRVLP